MKDVKGRVYVFLRGLYVSQLFKTSVEESLLRLSALYFILEPTLFKKHGCLGYLPNRSVCRLIHRVLDSVSSQDFFAISLNLNYILQMYSQLKL